MKNWGKHSPEKVVQVRPAVKTPFLRLSRRSLDPQLQHDSVLETPVEIKIIIKITAREICQKFKEFSVVKRKFGPNFSSQALKMLKISVT